MHLNPECCSSWQQYPVVCSYRGALCRQLFLSSCTLSLPWLQTEILHELREFKPELEKGTTLIWNLQVVKPTSVHLLRRRVVSPMVISTSIQKQSEKWQNSSAYLHWRYKYPCMNVCNVVFMSLGTNSPAIAYCNISQAFPFSQVLILAKTQAPCQIFYYYWFRGCIRSMKVQFAVVLYQKSRWAQVELYRCQG